MKKSSLFVAMFLIAALIFTVSCPSNFAVNIVGDKDIEQEVTVDTESTFTFDIEVSNGAFLESAKDKAITVNIPADFDNAEDKAVVSASVTTLGEKDATTGKITKATVTVLFTAKNAVSEAKELTFEIPASDNPAILEGVKDKITISGKKVLVTAVPKPLYVALRYNNNQFTLVGSDTQIAYIYLDHAKWVDKAFLWDELNGLTFNDNNISASITRTKEQDPDTGDTINEGNTLYWRISGNADSSKSAAEKEYFFNITTADATPDEGYVLPENFKASFFITVQ